MTDNELQLVPDLSDLQSAEGMRSRENLDRIRVWANQAAADAENDRKRAVALTLLLLGV